MKKAIDKGLVSVNGVVAKTGTFLKGGETVTLSSEGNKTSKPILQLPLKICFENDHLAIINKPCGILVSGNKKKTIANALVHNLTKSGATDALLRPKPVHRLDFPTSGLLLIAKTHATVMALNKLFEDRKVKKTYHAVTYGKMPLSGTITTKVNGKDAFTEYKVLQTVPSDRFDCLNLVELFPKTGRKHQIRVHLSSFGTPILGDKNYGKEGLVLKGKGLFLNASKLEFIDPITDEFISVTTALPKKFKKIFPKN
ncbi:RluA family pseudouridine synthase [Marixanthomonas spongiae]|uniref:RNA pseudouridine synthase n=1 Tax=Marixanthomonas spongiae TaxID=2174845 RepID=A0A2U0HY77_9FLAO|nr:RluA family pseudouridine synthase [Marixanthomonas spongiae]PVW13788.1 RNA pseudouridine synthase [Marixanthomonas spongiae]